MYTACYTVHTTQYLAYYIYCIAANFELVQIFAYFVLNFTVQKWNYDNVCIQNIKFWTGNLLCGT